MQYGQLYSYADNIVAANFQGGHPFKDSEIEAARETLKDFLTEPLQANTEVSELFGSRMLQ